MKRRSKFKLLGVMACAMCVPLALARAQGVSLGNDSIKIDTLAGTASQILAGAIFLGSNGTPGNLFLLGPNGTGRISLFGNDANLFLGGGNADGDVRLTDTDGSTTTIDLNGEFGLATLGSVDDDGDLWVMDNDPDGLVSIGLDGGTGDVTNQLDGNGLVKAWARINADGSVLNCWRCSPEGTSRFGEGDYLVSFSSLGAIISARPRLATLDAHASGISNGQISLVSAGSADRDKIVVHTDNSSGDPADRGFTLFVF